MTKISEKDDTITIEFYVKPSSKVSKLSNDGESLTLYITCPPEKGKANKEIIHYLSKLFGVMKSQISIISGLKSNTKVILFSDLGFEQKQQFYSIINKSSNELHKIQKNLHI